MAEDCTDFQFNESEDGFVVQDVAPFIPSIEFATYDAPPDDPDAEGPNKESDGDVTGFSYQFNQAYIFNTVSESQIQITEDRKISNMEDPFVFPNSHDKYFFVEVIINAENFLIDKATFTGVDNPDDLVTTFPHIIFEQYDPSPLPPFTGYYPILRMKNGDMEECTQRSNIILSDRQFDQLGYSVYGESAHVLVAEARKDENFPVRVRTIEAGTGITVQENGNYITIHSDTGESDFNWSGESVGGGAEVYKEYTLLPSEFRSITGEDNITVAVDGDVIDIRAKYSNCSDSASAEYKPFKQINTENPPEAEFRVLNAGNGITITDDGDDCSYTVATYLSNCTPSPDDADWQAFKGYNGGVAEFRGLKFGCGIGTTTTTDDCRTTIKTYLDNCSSSAGYKPYKGCSSDGTTEEFAILTAGDHITIAGGPCSYTISSDCCTGTETYAVQSLVNINNNDTKLEFPTADTSTAKFDLNGNEVVLMSLDQFKVQKGADATKGKIQLGNVATQTIETEEVNSLTSLTLGAGISTLDSKTTADSFVMMPLKSTIINSEGSKGVGNSPTTGSPILGGSGHLISGNYNTIVGGLGNRISGKSFGFIGGGTGIDVIESKFSVSVGGNDNDITGAMQSAILGGKNNSIYGMGVGYTAGHAIGGGTDNLISGSSTFSSIAGGTSNRIENQNYGFIGAGASNVIHVGGTTAYGDNNSIAGGFQNVITGSDNFIGGGRQNLVSGTKSAAFGYKSVVNDKHGAFVFSDSNTNTTYSSGDNTCLFNFAEGVFIDGNSGLYVNSPNGIHINGNPVMTGASDTDVDTLQTVTTRGNTTTTDILSEGEISGASGEFGGQVTVLGKLAVGTKYSTYDATIDGTLQVKDIDGGTYDGMRISSSVGGEARIAAGNTDHGTTVPLHLKGEYLKFSVQTGTAVEAMRIVQGGDGSGSVGIGTSDPDSKLHIYAANPNIFLEESDATSTFNITDIQLAGGALNINTRQSNGAFVSTDYQIAKNANGATDHKFFITGSEKVRIDSDGYVGIGISSPDTKLHLEDGRLTIKGNGSEAIKVTNSDIVNFDLSTVRADLFRASAVSDQLEFRGGSNRTRLLNSDGGTELFTITNSGYVGIGVTDPDAPLHVKGNIRAEATASTSFADFKSSQIWAGSTYDIIVGTSNPLYFRTNDTRRMTIEGGGNVGIGITNPSQLLNISGGHILIDHQDPQLMFNDIGGSTHTASWMYQNNSMDFVWGGGKKFTIDSAGGVTLGQEYSTGYSAPSKGMIMEGNLGIGTNAPSHKLNVAVSDGDDGIVLQKAGSSNDIFRVTMDGTSDQGEMFLYDGAVCEFAIRANTNFSYINTPANFGIGTTSPARKLEVSEGSSSIVSQFKSTAGTSAYITLANTTSTADKIRFGSIGNDLILSSNYTDPDIYIEAGGKVGIGTTNPSEKLHVSAGSLEITSGSHIMTNGYSITWGTGNASKIYAGDGVQDMAFTAGSSLAMIINGSSQNVGIGTNAPAYKLDIQAAAAEIAQIKRTNGGNCEFLINPVGGDAKVVFQNSGTDIWAIGKDNSDSSFRISEGGALETNPRFTVDNGGNVGIGTTNPAKKLTVYHAGNAEASITGTNVAIFTISDPNSHGQLNTYNDGTFRINSEANAGGTQLVLSGSNVGVGTAFPSYKLDVNGTIHGTSGNFEDGITVNGNPVLTGTSAYETDTLQTVTDDGNTTTNSVHISNAGFGADYAPLTVSGGYGGGSAPLAFFRGTGTTAYIQCQNSTTSYGSASQHGLTIGNNGNDAYIMQREAAPMYFGTSGEARMTILGDSTTHSKVGIGTIAPASTAGSDSFLEIYGATDAGLVISSNNGEWDLKNTNPTANLSLYAAGSHRVTFAYAGNVGIGSATPSEKLDVNGSIILRGSTNHRYKVANDSNNNWAEIGNDGASSENTLEFFTKSSSVPAMSITNDDRVGIGTTNPSHKLHVKTSGAGDWITRIDNTSSSSSYGLKVGAGTDSSDIGFEVANYNGDIGLRVQGNSHVGIGTTSADAFLNIYNTGTTSSAADVHIVGSGNTYGLLYERLRNDSLIVSKSTTAGSYFKTDSATVSFQGYEIGTNWFLGQYGYNDFRITDGSKSGGTAALTIQDATQNVGIGTTSPDTKLHVKGTAIRFEEAGGSTRHFDIIPATAGVNHKFTSDSTSAGYEFYNNANSLVNFTNTEATFNPSGENIDFRVKSSGSTALFVDAAIGNVGIGSATPATLLDVDGAANDGIRIGTNNALIGQGGATGTQLLFWNGTSAYYGRSAAPFNHTVSNHFFRVGGNDVAMIGSAGVGIGTLSPTFSLDVETSDEIVASFVSTDNKAGVLIQDDDTAGYVSAENGKFSIGPNNGTHTGNLTIDLSNSFVGIGTNAPSYELDVNGTTRSTYYIGGAYLEENVSSSKLKFYTDGTVLVMDEDGSLKPCEEENDTLVFGVSKKDFDQPVVLGAEPVLVTGPIKVGDYIVTSSKQGHGQAMKEEKLGTIIAQAMENGDGESHNIKAMVRKM